MRTNRLGLRQSLCAILRVLPSPWALSWMAAVAVLIAVVLAARPSVGQEPQPTKPTVTSKGPAWVRVTGHAAWKPRDSSGEVTFQGKMWLLGGWFNSHGPFPNDVWCSSDGVQWKLVPRRAVGACGFADHAGPRQPHRICGGWSNGRLPGASASNQVWHSSDGIQWRQTTAKAAWSPRLGAGGAVLGGKMWILGGIENYYFGTKKDLLNDVWSSADGSQWNPATHKAPWTPRAYHAVLAFNNKLWVLGGGNYLPTYEAHNDVWSSPDGIH